MTRLMWPQTNYPRIVQWDLVRREHVEAAIDECDRLGEDDFLAQTGFGRARDYHLIFRGASYPSKAILGVAYRQAPGTLPSRQDFSGGRTGAAKVLRDLGFEVTEPEA